MASLYVRDSSRVVVLPCLPAAFGDGRIRKEDAMETLVVLHVVGEAQGQLGPIGESV
jgi:hypothetical protein